MQDNITPVEFGGERLYPQQLVADRIGCTVRTLENWRQRRVGPAWVKVGHRIMYREPALHDWIRANEQQPVAGAAPVLQRTRAR